MMELFRLDVFAFIKKPIIPESFSETFLEANQKICSKNFFFPFKYRNQECKIPCKDILYYESRGRQITIMKKVELPMCLMENCQMWKKSWKKEKFLF